MDKSLISRVKMNETPMKIEPDSGKNFSHFVDKTMYVNEEGAYALEMYAEDNKLVSFQEKPSKDYPYKFYITSKEQQSYAQKNPKNPLFTKNRFNVGGFNRSMIVGPSEAGIRLHKLPEYDTNPVLSEVNGNTSSPSLEEIIVPRININELKKDLLNNPQLIAPTNDNNKFMYGSSGRRKKQKLFCIEVFKENYYFNQAGILIPGEFEPIETEFMNNLVSVYRIDMYNIKVSNVMEEKINTILGDTFKYKQS